MHVGFRLLMFDVVPRCFMYLLDGIWRDSDDIEHVMNHLRIRGRKHDLNILHRQTETHQSLLRNVFQIRSLLNFPRAIQKLLNVMCYLHRHYNNLQSNKCCLFRFEISVKKELCILLRR